MAVFTWKAEVESSGSGEFIVFASKFGDGYSQEVPNGLNNETQKWNVSISGYGPYIRQVLDFIRDQKGMSFQWKAPNTSGLGWFRCKRYSESDKGGDYWTLNMEFEQGYAP